MEQEDLRKIVIIGPESTGKSTLCKQLAEHFKTSWCQEYARAYLLQHGMNYTFADLLTIAKGQIETEDRCIREKIQKGSTNGLLFIDTDMYVMKVWCEFVFEKCHHYIIDQIVNRQYQLYLLCNIDLPWIRDELREYPDPEPRRRLFNIYKDILINQPTPWNVISGNYEQRLKTAIEAVASAFAPPEL